jgi:mycothiol synthase
MRLRAPTDGDAEAVAKLVIAGDIADIGEPDYTLEDLRDEWGAKDFDLAADAVLADDGGRAVGYAAFRGSAVLVTVDPARTGEGIGTALRAWAEERARARGLTELRQYAGHRNVAARRHLEAAGYEQERSYWRMELDLEGDESPPPAPKGVLIRPLDRAADAHGVYEVNEAAFARNADYERETRERFLEQHFGAYDLDPRLSLVAARDGQVIGFALVRRHDRAVAYVDALAVHPDEAGHGLGGTLLRTAFAAAARAGVRRGQLGVASDNPNAIRLYARVGMTQRWRVQSYSKSLYGTLGSLSK